MNLAVAWAANFTFIGLKAAQQLHVVHNKKVAVVVTSNLLAAVEVLVLWAVVKTANTPLDYLKLVLTLGTSGGLGCVLAMTLHNHYFKGKKL